MEPLFEDEKRTGFNKEKVLLFFTLSFWQIKICGLGNLENFESPFLVKEWKVRQEIDIYFEWKKTSLWLTNFQGLKNNKSITKFENHKWFYLAASTILCLFLSIFVYIFFDLNYFNKLFSLGKWDRW